MTQPELRSTGKTGRELSLEMADALLNIFGALKPTDEDREKLAGFIVEEGLRWVDDYYKLRIDQR